MCHKCGKDIYRQMHAEIPLKKRTEISFWIQGIATSYLTYQAQCNKLHSEYSVSYYTVNILLVKITGWDSAPSYNCKTIPK